MASKYCDRVKACKYNWFCADDYNPELDNYECFIQLTNSECIRSLSDEELAWFYADKIASCYGCESSTMEDCAKCWLDWLKSPVEVEAQDG